MESAGYGGIVRRQTAEQLDVEKMDELDSHPGVPSRRRSRGDGGRREGGWRLFYEENKTDARRSPIEIPQKGNANEVVFALWRIPASISRRVNYYRQF